VDLIYLWFNLKKTEKPSSLVISHINPFAAREGDKISSPNKIRISK
jgi:hypothetical protein